MGRKYIKTFTASTKGYKTLSLPRGGNPGTPQSMALLPGNVVAVFHNKDNGGRTAHCRKYKQGGYVSNSDVVNNHLGHCNGATYCDKNGYIYCTGYNEGSNTRKIIVLNTNFKQVFSFDLPVSISGIAYDRTVEKFYCSKGSSVYVFPFSAFKKEGRTKKYKRFSVYGGTGQDMGGYNGIIYRVLWHPSYGDIDLYKHSNGKYIGSIKVTYSETESCAFDNEGNFVYLTANQNRAIHWTKWKPQYKDGSVNADPAASSTSSGNAAKKFLEVAKKEVGTKETGSNNVKYNTWFYGHPVSGGDYSWCAAFVSWCGYKAFGNNKRIPKKGLAHEVQSYAVTSGGGNWVLKGSFPKNADSAKKCKPGDIITFDWNHNDYADHVGIVEKVDGSTIHTIEGNHNDRVEKVNRNISEVYRVARPNWPDGTYELDDEESSEGPTELVLEVHPEQLFSSENYHYIEQSLEESEEQKASKERQKQVKEYLHSINISDSIQNVAIPDIKLKSLKSASNYKKPKTKVEGDISGSGLPCTINYVEAPYGKITIGGVTIGSYTGKSFPNYLNSITVKKTNGSMNEYTISLTHQITSISNPNYIDNLISKNGYNKIEIEYGDAEAGISYKDVNALLINATSNFDFFNNCIHYTLSATSSSVMSAVNRRNYSAINAKPSTIINDMLYETGELLEYFPAMADKLFVSSNNLIPSNDKEIKLDAVNNTTPLSYLNKLVSSMTSITSKTNNDSAYYLSIEDTNKKGPFFSIQEVKTKIAKNAFPLIYEVDINYPDENSLVYNFSVDTDFYWPLAYEYAGKVSTYNYDIDNAGNTISQKLTSNIKSIASTDGANVRDKNWWTNVTEFPIKATLEVKGLTTYTLLLNYIKVNVFYFGQKRNSSGVYIVTGQEDSLSGNGFTTKLELLRVAGDNQYITIDGRVIT